MLPVSIRKLIGKHFYQASTHGFNAKRQCPKHSNVYNPLATRAPNKNILDGQLLSAFINLPISKQRDLVQPIGTTRETVLNDLNDLSGFGDFF